MFTVIFEGKYGNTVESENPKLDAYKHMAYLRICGQNSGLIIRDGCYTVQSEKNGYKLADMTFQTVTIE
jgi:hypothetical protein